MADQAMAEFTRPHGVSSGETVSPAMDIGPSMEANYIGGKMIADLVADRQFMVKPNWSGELAGRVYQAMVRQAVQEGRLVVPSERYRRWLEMS